jgi:hypothetical protein
MVTTSTQYSGTLVMRCTPYAQIAAMQASRSCLKRPVRIFFQPCFSIVLLNLRRTTFGLISKSVYSKIGLSMGTRQRRQSGAASPMTISSRPHFGQRYFICSSLRWSQKTFDAGRVLWLR